ncbi:MAG: SpoIIE family protein phosphatase [Alphaproteobacteria bacterium]|nr:SpoIIE family protein phosphatase [Alphaproteobacteria bacterium]
MKITTRLILLLIGSVGLVYTMLQLYVSFYYADVIKKQLQNESELLTSLVLRQVENMQKSTERSVGSFVRAIEVFKPTEKQIYQYMTDTLETAGGNIYGMAFAYPPEKRVASPYAYIKDKKVVRVDLADHYKYYEWQWFSAPVAEKKPLWSLPYYDKYSENEFMTTYSYPIYKNGVLEGVLAADVSLRWLKEYLELISYNNEYIFILANDNGAYISYPDNAKIGSSIINETKNPQIKEIALNMLQGKTGTGTFSRNGEDYYVNYTTIPSVNWSVGVVFNADKASSLIQGLEYKSIAIIVGGLLFILFLIALVAHSITAPILKLSDYVTRLGKGALAEPVPGTRGKDEVAVLARNVAKMQKELAHYIKALKTSISEKERMDSELRLARDIQKSFLPRENEKTPDNRFDVAAILKPAREVGGDLYDFFMVDKDHVCLVIGDVADKGVPASIYMAVTLTALRALARLAPSPALILTRLNNYLVSYNDSNMFVTLLCLMINLKTGEVLAADAGHGMLYRLKKDRLLRPKLEKNLALGVSEDVLFTESSFKLAKGDALFLYTDGVSDILNADDDSLDEANLQKILSEVHNPQKCSESLEEIAGKVRAFSKKDDIEDDTTMLLFAYRG